MTSKVKDFAPQKAQRVSFILDYFVGFKHKQEDGSEIDLQRFYNLTFPYGAPYEEILKVLELAIKDVKEMEEIGKEAAKKQKEEQEQKKSETEIEDKA